MIPYYLAATVEGGQLSRSTYILCGQPAAAVGRTDPLVNVRDPSAANKPSFKGNRWNSFELFLSSTVGSTGASWWLQNHKNLWNKLRVMELNQPTGSSASIVDGDAASFPANLQFIRSSEELWLVSNWNRRLSFKPRVRRAFASQPRPKALAPCFDFEIVAPVRVLVRSQQIKALVWRPSRVTTAGEEVPSSPSVASRCPSVL